MRVLLTTDTIGGVWTFTKELATGFLTQGHVVCLVSFGRAPSMEQALWCTEMLRRHGSAFQYHPSSVPLEWMSDNDAAYRDAEPLLLRITASFQPDVIHCNQFCFGKLPVGVPLVITAHSDVVSWAAACRPKGLLPSAWLTHYRRLVGDGLAAADAVVAPTRWMLSTLCKQHGSLPGHLIFNGRTVVPSGIKESRLPHAVSVGRFWDDAKNLKMLTKVRSPFPLFVAGEHDFGLISNELDLGDIQSLGHLEERQLHQLFRQSSIYLATSIYEPFGLAPLEAALCGCAVVANDIPSLREVWGDAALYFDSADTLTALLLRLHLNPALLAVVRRRCATRAQNYSSWSMTNNYINLYQTLAVESVGKTRTSYVA